MPIVEIFFFAVLIIAALFWSAITRNQHLKDEKLDEAVKAELPGGFLYYVILKIYEEVVTTRKQAGQWKDKSKELLNRIFGFELLIAPYVVSPPRRLNGQ